MFRMPATRGRKRSTHSSWNDETSVTATSGGSAAARTSGVPRLPPVKTRRPPAASARPTSVVVVLLPFVPVMPITGQSSSRNASSTSAHTGSPRRTASRRRGAPRGTPGLGTTRSTSSRRAGVSAPSRSSTPGSDDESTPRADASWASAARTVQPRDRSTRATAWPVRRRPSTRTRRGSSMSAQLEGGERHQGAHDRDDPEADDDLRLGPAEQLEVVVNGRHAEDALAAQLERDDLPDDRQRLHDEDEPDEQQDDLLPGDQRHGAEGGAERERADVAHEHLRGIGVEPEKAQPRRHQRAAEHGQLARAAYVRDLEVVGEDHVAGGVREHRVGGSRDHDGA